jgi:hypothetical protein
MPNIRIGSGFASSGTELCFKNRAQDASEEEVEDSFLANPRYRYSFNVVDNEQQVYQDQSQQMEDRVGDG